MLIIDDDYRRGGYTETRVAPIRSNVSAEEAPAKPRLPADGSDRVHDSEAEYTLEYEVICPFCKKELKTLRVVRLLRTRVNFTSTLPRRGRATICPECRKILGAELTIA